MFGEQPKESGQLDQENLLKKEAIPPPEEPKQIKLFKLEKQFKAGANWFYLVAGLSIVNSLIFLSGSELSFLIGLGATQLVDGFMFGMAEELGRWDVLKYVAFGINVVIAGVYIAIGVFAIKGYKEAFIAGMIFYALDGLIFLLVKDFLSIGFHIFVLFCILGGLNALNKLEKMQRESQPVSTTMEERFGG